MIRKAGVMGWPIDHSRSPALHGFWLKAYGVEGSYMPLPIQPAQLGQALGELRDKGFAGVNLTVPHKEAALPFLDAIMGVNNPLVCELNIVFFDVSAA